LAALAVVLVGLVGVAAATGVTEGLTVEGLRELTGSAGAWGLLGLLGAFVLGTMLYLPGMMFVGVAAVAYGPCAGIPVALVGAVLAVMVSFWVVRGVGGQLLTEVQRPLMRRLLAGLDRRPVLTVAALRLFFWVGPPLNYALALSSVKGRDYFVGSVLGLAGPVAVAVLLVGQVT
jgi:uncharacterized membrane protein YdjX (TVP38/TMEM64 family)